MSLRAVLALVAGALEPAQHGWAVIGAVALGVHGVARTTLDLELFGRTGQLDELAESLERALA